MLRRLAGMVGLCLHEWGYSLLRWSREEETTS
jgi:hypothetical protein